MNPLAQPDPWLALRQHTAARIAIGRTGASLPTREVLAFGVAHAQARDAVHLPLDREILRQSLQDADFATLLADSAATDRATYLRRPDLGRRLCADSAVQLDARPDSDKGADIVFMIGDGLSSKAIARHAQPFLLDARSRLEALGYRIGPVVLAGQARVALGDDVGERLKAKLVVVMIGERPGLSSPDSMGIYMTWQPHVGRLESERNCISNIRPEGLPYAEAAHKLTWLINEAFRRQITGVELKDESNMLSQEKLQN